MLKIYLIIFLNFSKRIKQNKKYTHIKHRNKVPIKQILFSPEYKILTTILFRFNDLHPLKNLYIPNQTQYYH